VLLAAGIHAFVPARRMLVWTDEKRQRATWARAGLTIAFVANRLREGWPTDDPDVAKPIAGPNAAPRRMRSSATVRFLRVFRDSRG
jgi:hypothetical protein